ncbi:DUF1145 domain-containing protein [Shewanella sp.]|uniref:DUF1145 domain-containing protein n=1 Tax=Shewanella sp. TaxID=50422 RepID=UPI001EBEEA64|nr:DUF1145 domain-containing protein [Shewanella sp.]NRB22249.1 DUF1145 domain-containing protein [Shewanella sp.]
MTFINLFITAGKAITLLAWLIMAYNLVQPFAGNLTVILNILFAVPLFMHGVQVVIFYSRFNSRLTLHKSDYLNVRLLNRRELPQRNEGNLHPYYAVRLPWISKAIKYIPPTIATKVPAAI